MTKTMETDKARYLKEVEALLVGNSSQKKKLLTALESDIADYLEEHPGAELDELIQHFGTPESIANEQLISLEPDRLRARVTRDRILRIIIGVAVVLILGAALVYGITRILYAANGNPMVIIEQPRVVSSIPTQFQ